MVEIIFKLACLVFICFIVFAYFCVSVEDRAQATQMPIDLRADAPKTPAVKKKETSCSCCADRIEQIREQIQLMNKRSRQKSEDIQNL